jgi:hypothetical protein
MARSTQHSSTSSVPGASKTRAIQTFIGDHPATGQRCSFCDGGGDEPVAWLRQVLDFMLEGIHREYRDAVEVSPYNGAEGRLSLADHGQP